MALLLDGPPSTIDDLTGFDSQLLDVASTERIDVTRKLGLAQDEVTVDLQALLSRSASQSSSGLANVVVTPALRLWHAYRTLELVYGDAYHSQLNDRYAGRRDQFRQMANWARQKLIETGLGIVSAPVPQGLPPDLTLISGSLPSGTYYITITFVNEGGEEGRYAPPTIFTAETGGFIARVNGLPGGTTGWKLYAGSGPQEMTLQNTETLRSDQEWIQAEPLSTNGAGPSEGQTAATVRAVPRVLLRG